LPAPAESAAFIRAFIDDPKAVPLDQFAILCFANCPAASNRKMVPFLFLGCA
jgi:hypothetical protein